MSGAAILSQLSCLRTRLRHELSSACKDLPPPYQTPHSRACKFDTDLQIQASCYQQLQDNGHGIGTAHRLPVCDLPGLKALLKVVQAIIQILQPLAGPKVGEAVRKTVNEIFGVFAQSMAAAFQKFMRPDGTFPPRLGKPTGCFCVL